MVLPPQFIKKNAKDSKTFFSNFCSQMIWSVQEITWYRFFLFLKRTWNLDHLEAKIWKKILWSLLFLIYKRCIGYSSAIGVKGCS
jgi:hypothetical protein